MSPCNEAEMLESSRSGFLMFMMYGVLILFPESRGCRSLDEDDERLRNGALVWMLLDE